MQFTNTFLFVALAALSVGASPLSFPGGQGGTRKGGSSTNINQCSVTQNQNCCNIIKKGSSQHKRWTDKYHHLKPHSGGDYLSCKSTDSSATCSQDASPFCCNASGSSVSIANCSPINVDLGSLGDLGGLGELLG